ncbi:hypothetical protein [Achromobacter anxifer]|uniref:Uncharacterized protein n=1 Tax=Achromobacter anxifer TaxID=1287737 RepID=A0A6S7DPZ8_9BURK|nr:hypothetical protein [Achromobacter anxifer]MDF8360853.1 hypothetical protein [Achromobacter anxifer]CAB3872741.1 hypothetical protein LMG26858_02814 [Achromobacter anxifer]
MSVILGKTILDAKATKRVRRNPEMLGQYFSKPEPPKGWRIGQLMPGESLLLWAYDLQHLMIWMDNSKPGSLGAVPGSDQYVSTFYEYRRAPENETLYDMKTAAKVCYAASVGLLVAECRQLVNRGEFLPASHLEALRLGRPARDMGMARSCLLVTKRTPVVNAHAAAADAPEANEFVSRTGDPKEVVQSIQWMSAQPRGNFLARTRSPAKPG